MLHVYYTLQPVDSKNFICTILQKYGIFDPKIAKNAFGKPYLCNFPLFFNLSHSNSLTVLAISDKNVGIDCEFSDLPANARILAHFTQKERDFMQKNTDFYQIWTAKEAYAKYLGDSVFRLYKRLEYTADGILLSSVPQPVACRHFTIEAYTVCLCSAENEVHELFSV